VPLSALVPTMHYDAQLVLQSEGRLSDYRAIAVPVLLLGGSDSPTYLQRTLDALETPFPACAESNSSESGILRPTTQVSLSAWQANYAASFGPENSA